MSGYGTVTVRFGDGNNSKCLNFYAHVDLYIDILLQCSHRLFSCMNLRFCIKVNSLFSKMKSGHLEFKSVLDIQSTTQSCPRMPVKLSELFFILFNFVFNSANDSTLVT